MYFLETFFGIIALPCDEGIERNNRYITKFKLFNLLWNLINLVVMQQKCWVNEIVDDEPPTPAVKHLSLYSKLPIFLYMVFVHKPISFQFFWESKLLAAWRLLNGSIVTLQEFSFLSLWQNSSNTKTNFSVNTIQICFVILSFAPPPAHNTDVNEEIVHDMIYFRWPMPHHVFNCLGKRSDLILNTNFKLRSY